MCEKDYSLLRPFDLDAAKRGDAILWIVSQSEPVTFVGRSRCGKTNIIECEEMRAGSVYRVLYAPDKHLRMAPLCWVEGKPVYKGDVLYYKPESVALPPCEAFTDPKTVSGFSKGRIEWSNGNYGLPRNLTWTPPKVKREGWINIYKPTYTKGLLAIAFVSDAYSTRKDADDYAENNRKACIHIEWEE